MCWGKFPRTWKVTLSEDKTAKLVEALNSLLTGPVIPIATLRYAVGVLGWLSGIIPEARPWLSMLWAALTEGSQRSSVGPKRNTTRLRKGLLFRKQVEHATNWLLKIVECKTSACSLRHRYLLRPQLLTWFVIESDACPHGMGAVLKLFGDP